MGDIIKLLGRNLTGSHTVGTNTLDNIERLVEATGSGRAAARALGVAESTLRGWRRGVKPRRPAQWFQAQTRRVLASRRDVYADAWKGDRLLRIKGLIRVSKDVRVRTIDPGKYIPNRVIRRVLSAWENGDDDKAENILIRAIDQYYQPLAFQNIIGVWFE